VRTFKAVIAVIGALIPVLYCFGLVIYFVGVRRWLGLPLDGGLGPTILGLGVIGLLFTIPLVRRLIRLLGTPR
jgi:hypothetical protein